MGSGSSPQEGRNNATTGDDWAPPRGAGLRITSRILRDASRSRLRNSHDLRSLLAALRAAHPQRKLLERCGPADKARQGFGFNVSGGTALAAHAHQELPEAIVQLFDVSEHAHGRMVLTAGTEFHAVPARRAYCTQRARSRGDRIGRLG